MQKCIFDAQMGRMAKEEGMNLAAENKRYALIFARDIAEEIALKSPTRECTTDDVQKIIIAKGINLGNAAGSLFKESKWKFTGRFVESHRVSNHGRLLHVWRLES
jgi:hypothetical protein